jgi:twitching motility two-component system response regulator PilH
MKRILVIDDDPGMRLLLKKLLESAGYAVVTADEGQAGMEAAWSSPPNLVISDMDMPVHDGFKTIRMFRCDPTLWVPVIIVSGVVDERDSQLVLDAGASAFFQKPVNQEALLAKVAELLSGQD